jgi:hypothetical protein
VQGFAVLLTPPSGGTLWSYVMAYPDSPNHTGMSPAALAGSRLTPEDAEKLAATFRPSWELDDAPFAGPAAFADAELPALRGGGTQADVRGAVQALNGTHAPAPATVLENEPTSSVILGGGIDAEDPPTVVQRPPADPGAAAKAMSAPATTPAILVPTRAAPAAPSPPRHVAAGPRIVPASDADRLPKRSRLGLWLGLGAAGIGIVIGAWLAAGSGDKRDAAAPPVDTPVVTTASPIPPPPPPTETAQTAPPAVQATAAPPTPPPPAAAIPEPPPRVTPSPPVAAAPVIAPTPAPAPPPRAASTGHQAASWGGGAAPAPKAPTRPKGAGTTIVRDVPF